MAKKKTPSAGKAGGSEGVERWPIAVSLSETEYASSLTLTDEECKGLAVKRRLAALDVFCLLAGQVEWGESDMFIFDGHGICPRPLAKDDRQYAIHKEQVALLELESEMALPLPCTPSALRAWTALWGMALPPAFEAAAPKAKGKRGPTEKLTALRLLAENFATEFYKTNDIDYWTPFKVVRHKDFTATLFPDMPRKAASDVHDKDKYKKAFVRSPAELEKAVKKVRDRRLARTSGKTNSG